MSYAVKPVPSTTVMTSSSNKIPIQPDDHELFVERVARQDVEALKKARQSYGESWRKRGGVGAFMMLARKWDRLEHRVQQYRASTNANGEVFPWDIFSHVLADTRAEGVIDDIRDLRRYLILVEAHLLNQAGLGESRDNKEQTS